MAVNEEIVTGKKFRRLIDVATNKWRRYSFWNKAKDTECEDGTDVETKVGAIKGITTSTNVSETGYAADAKTVSEINQSLANKIPDYAHFDTLGTPTTGGATYNISKDGFFQLHGATLTTSASIFYRIRINNVIIEEGYTVNMRYGYYTSPLFPVLKNDIVKVEVDTNVAGVNYVAKLYHAR